MDPSARSTIGGLGSLALATQPVMKKNSDFKPALLSWKRRPTRGRGLGKYTPPGGIKVGLK